MISATDIAFRGWGPHDIFRQGGQHIGTVTFALAHPPFVRTAHPDFDYAPGYYMFPQGLIPIQNGQRADLQRYTRGPWEITLNAAGLGQLAQWEGEGDGGPNVKLLLTPEDVHALCYVFMLASYALQCDPFFAQAPVSGALKSNGGKK